MRRSIAIAVLLVMAGCATGGYQPPPSACAAGEATEACQVERYSKAF